MNVNAFYCQSDEEHENMWKSLKRYQIRLLSMMLRTMMRKYGNVGGLSMPKMDKDGREYIEQDGKRYYRNFLGEWEAEKDWLGNDKVEMDIFGNPKVERDLFGNQIIETDWFGNPYVEPENKEDSGCYLTTVCMQAMDDKFQDDCEELTILRQFRDNFVKKYHPEAIKEYYRIAPNIVGAIQKSENSQDIYLKIYEELVQETISLIREGRFVEAYALYRDYSRNLANEFYTI